MLSLICRIALAMCCLTTCVYAAATCQKQDERDDDAHRDAITAQRFFSIVEKNPQRGTALEKVFAHHLQLGTLDAFIGELEKRTKEHPIDGAAWMLLGLFESQRRMDTQAIVAFAEAERLRLDDPLPAYYRGQCLLRIGEPAQAILALEKAIERKPSRMVLLEVFELLGRTHQRQNRNDLAIDAWKRLEENFPNDLRVLEQIATIQSQEGAYQDALPRYERLITLTKDPYQRSQFRIEAAQLRVKLGASERGLLELQSVLGELRPDSWLYRDVQRKIEEVFLKSNDTAGLISHYEQRIEQNPDEIESIVRLCKFLVSSFRTAEANQWLSKAIERAPSRMDLRKSYIDQLIADQQFAAAIREFEALSQLDPKNADILRDWGKLLLRDPSRSAESAKQEASNIWKRIIDNNPEDALTQIQIAELLQIADLPGEAQKHLERAIELQPEEPQYREFLGDFLFRQNQRDRAFAIWDTIADGPRRNADSLMRLAEIYDHAQQQDKAAKLATEACALAPENGSLLVRAARFQKKADQIDDALASLSKAEKLADSNDQRDFITDERIRILEATNRLKSTAESLRAQLLQTESPNEDQLQLLARYLVRLRRWKEANEVVLKALHSREASLPMLRLSAEIAEGFGNADQAIESLRKLADSERRKRQEYLERIARIQIRQKKWTDAIKTAEELVAAMPSKIESYEFMAQVCMQAKNLSLAIATLRKALRIDPNSTRLTIQLASALIEHLDYNEAIELYWQSFTKASSLDDRLDLTTKLVSAHEKQNARSNSLNRSEYASPLIDRLEAGRKDPAQRRDFTICLAQVYQATSNLDKARRTLEELMSDRTRDTDVLQQMVKLSVASNDLELAIDYQRQLVAVVPSQENESSLANLLRQQGDWTEANEIVVRLIQNEHDPGLAIKNIDGLIQRGEYELALQTMEPMLLREPSHWELLFRVGVANAGIDQWAKSRDAFESLLKLEVDRSDSVVRRANTFKKRNPNITAQPPSTNPNSPFSALPDSDAELLRCLERPELTEIALGRSRIVVGVSSGLNGIHWSPENFGEMRFACIAWLLHCDLKDPGAKSQWLSQTLQKAESSQAREACLDAYAILKFQQDIDAMVSVATTLAQSGEPGMQAIYLDAVRRRQVSATGSENPNRKPLTSAQLDLLLVAYKAEENDPNANAASSPLSNRSFAIANAQSINAQMALMMSQVGQMPPAYRTQFLQRIQQGMILSASQSASSKSTRDVSIRTVINELGFAGRSDQAEAFLEDECKTANTEAQLSQLCEYLLSTQRFSLIERPLTRWLELQLLELKQSTTAGSVPGVLATSNPSWYAPVEFATRFVENSAEQVSFEFLIRIADSYLEYSNQKYRDKNFAPIDSRMFAGLIPRQVVRGNNATKYWCSYFISAQEQQLLQVLGNAAAQANRKDVWIAYLQSRSDQQDGGLKALEQLRFSLAMELIALPQANSNSIQEALLTISQEPGCELYAAASFLMREDYYSAMNIAKAFSPSTPKDTLIRELLLLHSAAAVNDKMQLDASLLSLANQKLDALTLQSISGVVQMAASLGLSSAKAQQLTLRPARAQAAVTRTAPKPTPSPEAIRAKEMKDHFQKGNQAEAIRIARSILSKPRILPPMGASSASSQGRNSLNSRNAIVQSGSRIQAASGSGFAYAGPSSANTNAAETPSTLRLAALDVLRSSNQLDALISETQKRLETSPNSFVLLDQLAEYHEFAGNAEEAIKAMSHALQGRPNASPLRIHLAEYLIESHQDQACDQFLELVRRDPDSGLSLIELIASLVDSSNRTPELLKAIQLTNFQTVQIFGEVLLHAKNLISKPQSFDVGAALLQKLVDSNPLQRQSALQFLYSTENMSYSEIPSFVQKALIPTEFDSLSDPWIGLHDINYNATTSEQSVLFESILSHHKKEDVIQVLEPAIQSAVKRMPRWAAGQVMLALMDLAFEQKESAKTRFAELASMKRLHVGCPDTIAMKLALAFEEQGENAAAIRMLESLVDRGSFFSVAAEKNHVLILAKLLVADGKREKAVEAVNKALESGQLAGVTNNGLSSRGNAATKNETFFADKLLGIGLPIEAYRLFDVQNGLMQFNSARYQGVRTIVVSRQGEAGKQVAIAQLQKLTPEQAIAELLYDRTLPTQKMPALELMFHIPSASDAASNHMESELQSRLIHLAKNGKLPEIEARLAHLTNLHPNDLTIHATLARVRLATGVGDAEGALLEVERILPSMLVEATLYDQNLILSLWLVAQECYRAGKHVTIADSLAERAMKAAKYLDRVPLAEFSPEGSTTLTPAGAKRLKYTFERANQLLLEWGDALIRSGNSNQGMEKWEELVGQLGDKSQSENRFELQASLAFRAAETRQIDLATKMATKVTQLWALAGTPKFPLKAIETILDCCESDAQRVDVLSAIIFFAPTEAMSLQAEEVELLRESPSNLGALLVLNALNSNRLDELKHRLEPYPFSLDREILKAQIAIAEKDFDTAKTCLKLLYDTYEKTRSLDDLYKVCQIAIPAFRIDEMRESTMPTLNALLQRERDRLRLPITEFNALPLVVEIDDYLRSKK